MLLAPLETGSSWHSVGVFRWLNAAGTGRKIRHGQITTRPTHLGISVLSKVYLLQLSFTSPAKHISTLDRAGTVGLGGQWNKSW